MRHPSDGAAQASLAQASLAQTPLPTPPDNAPTAISQETTGLAQGIAVGRIESISADGSLTVNAPALLLCGLQARSLVPLRPEHVGHDVALGFEGGNPRRPMVLGLVLHEPVQTSAPPAPPVDSPLAPPFEARVDGARVVIDAEHEIELRCGDAAIVLSADGRIQLRGTYITSHASATQRILGGSVNVN